MVDLLFETLEGRMLLSAGPRQMEYLDRGVVATRVSSSTAFVSWRSLALDPASMSFNLYRSINGGSSVKLNSSPLTGGTNYTDTTANNTSAAYSYFVRPVLNGVEQAISDTYTLAPNSASGPLVQIPLRNIGNYDISHMSVADLDGDGKYDYIVDRRPPAVNEVATQPDIIEAYKSDGTFLWSVDAGPNSFDQDNIEPGSTTIDVGNWDGVTAYDLDGDGRAEVFYRTANGVTFGDGSTLSYPANNDVQFMSVINGMTGSERARIQIPTDYLSDGPLACSLGVGYLDGVHPSLVAKLKNRIGGDGFNLMFVAYDFNGTSITQKWKYLAPTADSEYGHQIRIVDVDRDGTDEIAGDGGVLLLNGDGTLRRNLHNGTPSVGHGDRFDIGDFDPDRPGLEGYAVQQNNPSGLYEYYYDAATGEILHAHYTTPVVDYQHGTASDIDPNHRGYEYWSFGGVYTSTTSVVGQPPVETKLTDEPNRPWPNFSIWWDGDLLGENLNDTLIDKWNPAAQNTSRVTTLYHYGSPSDAATLFLGDIFGDWREEVIFENADHLALDIYTTQIASSTRLYTLAENPEYRNGLTIKGYLQQNCLDYYLGDGMTTPPTPNITVRAPFVDSTNAAPTVATAAAASTTVTTGKSVNLSVLGADDGGEANLTYIWAATGGNSAAGVTFSANNSNAAKTTTATFNAPGTYDFGVTIRDAGGKIVTSSVSVTVTPVITAIAVSPTAATVTVGTTQQFSATGIDQFGLPTSSSLTFGWLVTSGGGAINSSGLYAAPATTGSVTVQAQANSMTASAYLTIAPITDVYQAEDASVGGGAVIATNNGGYDGTGFVDFNSSGGFNEFVNVDGGAGGATNIGFRYALASGTRTGKLTVNGVARSISFTATGSFNSWAVLQIPVTLTAGATNTIRLESTGQNLANVDELEVQRGTGLNMAPTIAASATATPNPVNGTTADLSVIGADDGGESALTYTWAATGPASVTFSVNGTNGAKNTTATFSEGGTYTFAVTIRDAAELTNSTSVRVMVNIPLPSPIAWWKLNETSGTNVADSSGNGNNGTSVNGPSSVTGKFGNALSFDGSNDYVNLPTTLVTSTAGSVAMWVKTGASFITHAMLFYASPVTTGDGIGPEQELYVEYNASEQFNFFIKGASNVNITSPLSYADNAWHYVVAAWDASANATLYVDGAAVVTTVDDADTFAGSAVTRLGRPGANTRYYTGLIDDVQLYSFALSASTVSALYNTPAALLPGDANGDGKVNALDFNVVASNYGATAATWSTGDFNNDQRVDSADFTILATHFNQTQAGSAALAAGAAPDLFGKRPVEQGNSGVSDLV